MEITKENRFRFLLRLTELIELTKTKHPTSKKINAPKIKPQPQTHQ